VNPVDDRGAAPTPGPADDAFDVVVIGATADGLAVAEAAAARGARVALVDHDPEASRFELAWGAFRRRLVARADCSGPDGVVADSLAGGRRAELRAAFAGGLQAAEQERLRRFRANAATLTLLAGPARFLAADALEIGPSRTLRAAAYVVATGSLPRRPASLFGPGSPTLTAPALLAREAIPRSLAIVGADWSGCEWAHALTALGCTVQLIDRRTRLLRSLDAEIRTLVQTSLHRSGVEIALGEDVRGLGADVHGAVRLELASGRHLVTEAVLVLAGELGNTDALALAAAGVALDAQGHVLVDDRGRSNVPAILAAGSAVDSSGLFAPRLDQAVRLAGNALGGDDPIETAVPWNLCTDPPVAACGLNLEACARLDLPVVVGRHDARDADGRRDLLQVVVDRASTRILGAQAAGARAFATIDRVARAIQREASIDALLAARGSNGAGGAEASDDAIGAALRDARARLEGAARGVRKLRLARIRARD